MYVLDRWQSRAELVYFSPNLPHCSPLRWAIGLPHCSLTHVVHLARGFGTLFAIEHGYDLVCAHWRQRAPDKDRLGLWTSEEA